MVYDIVLPTLHQTSTDSNFFKKKNVKILKSHVHVLLLFSGAFDGNMFGVTVTPTIWWPTCSRDQQCSKHSSNGCSWYSNQVVKKPQFLVFKHSSCVKTWPSGWKKTLWCSELNLLGKNQLGHLEQPPMVFPMISPWWSQLREAGRMWRSERKPFEPWARWPMQAGISLEL